ncbi:hypothetical protein BH11BAC3_BH11BAC3_45540 [soil metagenome]
MSIDFTLCEAILKEHSKAQRDIIVQWIGTDQKRFNQLLQLFLKDEYRVTQRASWALSYCIEAHPIFIKNKLGLLIDNLQKPGLHDAIKRNTIRILQHINIPEKHQGKVMDICFNYVQSPTEAVAIKAFSLTVLGNLAKLYPEILGEIKLVIEEQSPHETAAFKSRAKRLLKEVGLS